MSELQKISVGSTMVDREFFYDNKKIMEIETDNIKKARKQTEDAATLLEERLPKLESTA